MGNRGAENENVVIETRFAKQMSMGYNEDAFLFLFKYVDIEDDSNTEKQFSVSIPADALQNIVRQMFMCGVEYQREYGKNIGFGTLEEE